MEPDVEILVGSDEKIYEKVDKKFSHAQKIKNSMRILVCDENIG